MQGVLGDVRMSRHDEKYMEWDLKDSTTAHITWDGMLVIDGITRCNIYTVILDIHDELVNEVDKNEM